MERYKRRTVREAGGELLRGLYVLGAAAVVLYVVGALVASVRP